VHHSARPRSRRRRACAIVWISKLRFLRFVFLLALLLVGCSGGGSASSTTWPTPLPGQWATAFGENALAGTTFDMPGPPGIHYVYTPANGLAPGKTMTLTYTLTGDATFRPDDASDINPPTISLFIWQAGDNLTCAGAYAGYRQFLVTRLNLQFGTHTVSAVIEPADWTGCYPGEAASAFTEAVANAAYMGFTFSGQYFAGHGVDVVSGSATFTINSFTVH
jgi:hypothetical protein